MMVARFVEVCRRGGLKSNANKSKVVVLSREEGLDWEIHVDGARWEQVPEFKYLGGVFWMNQVQVLTNVVRRWRAGGGLQVRSGPSLICYGSAT